MQTKPTELTNQQKMSAGLRELADFLDEHPKFRLPRLNRFYSVDTRDEFFELAKQFGPFTKSFDDDDFEITRWFGSIELTFFTSRENVCTRRVVGQEWEDGSPAKPATEGRMVDVVEWDCPDHLLSGHDGKETVEQ